MNKMCGKKDPANRASFGCFLDPAHDGPCWAPAGVGFRYWSDDKKIRAKAIYDAVMAIAKDAHKCKGTKLKKDRADLLHNIMRQADVIMELLAGNLLSRYPMHGVGCECCEKELKT